MLESMLSTTDDLLVTFVARSDFSATSATPPVNKGGIFVTASGMTLYTFDKDTKAGDTKAGDTTGDGFLNGAWRIAKS